MMASRKTFLVFFALISLSLWFGIDMKCDADDDVNSATNSQAGHLVAIEPMSSARVAHSATALPDGRILIAGGNTDPTAVSAELFDPATGTFVPAGPMITHRQSHTATLLQDGRVFLAGGYGENNVYLSSCEIFDPTTNEFTAASPMLAARAGQVATRLNDDRILFVGGVGTGWRFLSTAEIYNPDTGTFIETGSMNHPRESHVAVALPSGRVVIIGGHHGRRSQIQLLSSIEVYDPVAGAFSPAGDMAIARHKHDAILLIDGRILITGGTDERDYDGRFTSTEFFDHRTGISAAGADMQRPRYKHAGTSLLLSDGRVLLAGGDTEAEIYDPATNTFVMVPSDDRMVGQFSAAALTQSDGAVITGGYGSGASARASAWLFSN